MKTPIWPIRQNSVTWKSKLLSTQHRQCSWTEPENKQATESVANTLQLL